MLTTVECPQVLNTVLYPAGLNSSAAVLTIIWQMIAAPTTTDPIKQKFSNSSIFSFNKKKNMRYRNSYVIYYTYFSHKSAAFITLFELRRFEITNDFVRRNNDCVKLYIFLELKCKLTH